MNSLFCSRRHFVRVALGAMGGGWATLGDALAAPENSEFWDPRQPLISPGQRLSIQPVLMYRLPTRKEAASWKSWGGVQTEKGVAEEVTRIQQELGKMAAQTGPAIEIRPVAKVTSAEAARALAESDWDVTLVYACTGSGDLLEACLGLKKDALVFVRHQSGPVYYWYEALSSRLLATGAPELPANGKSRQSRAHVDDVVVDDYAELRWRLRAIQAVKSVRETRIVALGGPWGKYAPDAPQKAEERFGLKIIDVSYDDFAPRIQRALADDALVARAGKWLDQYLALPHTTLRTDRRFVVNAFVLYRLFKDLLREHAASAFTIKACMGTILPLARTTACLSLALLNDEGEIAFCESDFVIIPAGLLLRHVAGKPVFLHNSTFPHQGVVTCAHCTCPRRLDGRRYEPVQLLTHYESDYGAAPKVAMPVGQEATFIDPEYSSTRWIGFKGKVKSNPAYDICRSQQDVEIQGAWKKLIPEARDSHWVMAYGDHLRELAYAARKLGVQWTDLSATG